MGSDAKLRRILSKLDPKEREALDRFYYLQQTAGQISTELHIDAEKPRELKPRVKMAYSRPEKRIEKTWRLFPIRYTILQSIP